MPAIILAIVGFIILILISLHLSTNQTPRQDQNDKSTKLPSANIAPRTSPSPKSSPATNRPKQPVQGRINPQASPSVRPNVAPKTGSGTGKWRQPIHTGEKDFEEISALVEAHPGSTGRQLAAYARRRYGPSYDKHRVNSALYRMWHRGLVEKLMRGQVPHWYLK